MKDAGALFAGFAVACLGTLAAGVVLSPLRDDQLGTPVVILALTLAVAAAASLAGPVAGAVGTVTAVLSFDFFHASPYRELKLPSGEDRWAAGLLLTVGVAMCLASRRHRPARPDAVAVKPKANPSRHVQRIALLIQHGVDHRDLISAAQAELATLLLACSCRYEPGADSRSRPRLERDGSVSGSSAGDVPPAGELELVVRNGEQEVGRFVVEQTPGAIVGRDRRIAAVILIDHISTAITGRTSTVPPRR